MTIYLSAIELRTSPTVLRLLLGMLLSSLDMETTEFAAPGLAKLAGP